MRNTAVVGHATIGGHSCLVHVLQISELMHGFGMCSMEPLRGSSRSSLTAVGIAKNAEDGGKVSSAQHEKILVEDWTMFRDLLLALVPLRRVCGGSRSTIIIPHSKFLHAEYHHRLPFAPREVCKGMVLIALRLSIPPQSL